jgi:hypothetical protein
MNLRPFLEWLTDRLPPPRIIMDREGKSKYLSRWYLIGRPRMADGSSPVDASGQTKPDVIVPKGIGLYIHRFHRSDQDSACHSHPWFWARSLILAGGYVEERRVLAPPGEWPDRVVRFIRRPGSIVRLDADDFHRVDLIEKDSWSLFLAGPKAGSWSFWDRRTGEIMHWREFISRVRGDGWDGKKD